MNKAVILPEDKIEAFCKQNHICRLSVFGSVLRDDFGPESDVDVLVEFKQGYTPGFCFFKMQDELTEIIGRKVDLNTPNFLSKYFRNDVKKNAEVQYVQK